MRNFSVDLALQPHTDLSPAQIEEIDELLRLAFPEEFDFGYPWAPPEQHLTAWSEGELTSHVGLLERKIMVGERPIKVGGVGSVATHPDWQRNGIAHVLVRVAGEALHKNGCDFVLLFCDEKLAPYYQKCGYHRVHSPLFIHNDGRRMEIHEIIMAMPLVGEEWPEGEIDLLGLPW